MPIIAKKFKLPKCMPIIAKRFNYAELYQAYGHYTIAVSGLEPSKSEIPFSL